MKANELRIGNWVFDNDQLEEFTIESDTLFDESDGDCMEKHIKPIPLTEEWLVKFGAEKVNEISEYFDGEDMYSYELYLDGAECLFDRKCNCQPYEHIKYVHQLQNLYFALTGEELKQNVTENV